MQFGEDLKEKELEERKKKTSLNLWKNITDFVLYEEEDSFRFTLKAIK